MGKRADRLIEENRQEWLARGDFAKIVETVALRAVASIFPQRVWSHWELKELRREVLERFDQRTIETITARARTFFGALGEPEKWFGKLCGEHCVDWSPVPNTDETIGVCTSPVSIRRGTVLGCRNEACQWIREETVRREAYARPRKEEPEDVGEGRDGDSKGSSQDS